MLNEQSKKSKRKAARRAQLGPRTNFPQGQASSDVTPAHNPHGSGGVKRGIKKKDKKVPKVMPKYASGNAEMEMSHTVYHDMGYLMAESLGLVSEGTRIDTHGGTGPDRMSKTPFKGKPKKPGYDSKKQLQQDLATRRSSGKGFIGKGDTADNTIIVEPGTPLTPEQKEARSTFRLKQQGKRAKAAGKRLPKVIRRRKK